MVCIDVHTMAPGKPAHKRCAGQLFCCVIATLIKCIRFFEVVQLPVQLAGVRRAVVFQFNRLLAKIVRAVVVAVRPDELRQFDIQKMVLKLRFTVNLAYGSSQELTASNVVYCAVFRTVALLGVVFRLHGRQREVDERAGDEAAVAEFVQRELVVVIVLD